MFYIHQPINEALIADPVEIVAWKTRNPMALGGNFPAVEWPELSTGNVHELWFNDDQFTIDLR